MASIFETCKKCESIPAPEQHTIGRVLILTSFFIISISNPRDEPSKLIF